MEKFNCSGKNISQVNSLGHLVSGAHFRGYLLRVKFFQLCVSSQTKSQNSTSPDHLGNSTKLKKKKKSQKVELLLPNKMEQKEDLDLPPIQNNEKTQAKYRKQWLERH